jgi:hypothetical protein
MRCRCHCGGEGGRARQGGANGSGACQPINDWPSFQKLGDKLKGYSQGTDNERGRRGPIREGGFRCRKLWRTGIHPGAKHQPIKSVAGAAHVGGRKGRVSARERGIWRQVGNRRTQSICAAIALPFEKCGGRGARHRVAAVGSAGYGGKEEVDVPNRFPGQSKVWLEVPTWREGRDASAPGKGRIRRKMEIDIPSRVVSRFPGQSKVWLVVPTWGREGTHHRRVGGGERRIRRKRGSRHT